MQHFTSSLLTAFAVAIGTASLLPLWADDAKGTAPLPSQPNGTSLTTDKTTLPTDKPTQTLVLEYKADPSGWCLTPSIMAVLSGKLLQPQVPITKGKISAIDVPANAVMVTENNVSHRIEMTPLMQMAREEKGLKAGDLKVGDRVVLYEMGYTSPVFEDTLCSVLATEPLKLGIQSNILGSLKINASRLEETPEQIHLGNFGIFNKRRGADNNHWQPENVTITDATQVLFDRMTPLQLVDLRVGEEVRIEAKTLPGQPLAVTPITLIVSDTQGTKQESHE